MKSFKVVRNPFIKVGYIIYTLIALTFIVAISGYAEYLPDYVTHAIVIVGIGLSLLVLLGRKKDVGNIIFESNRMILIRNQFRKEYDLRNVRLVRCQISYHEGERDPWNYWSLFPSQGKENILILRLDGTKNKFILHLRTPDEVHSLQQVCEELPKDV